MGLRMKDKLHYEPDDLRELILGNIDDLIADYLYYDRKEDEDLPRGVIEKAVEDKIVTIEDMVARFESTLKERI